MNLRKTSLIFALAVLCVGTATAQTWEDRFSYRDDDQKYYGDELTFDAFGTYDKNFENFGDMFDRSWQHGDFGGGVGVNYFFTRYIGAGVDTFFKPEGQFFKNVSGSLILRLPIGETGIAPYGFAGGGGRFEDVDEAEGHVGVGTEFRINRWTGLFGDIRYAWVDKTENFTLVRVGLRFAFAMGDHDHDNNR